MMLSRVTCAGLLALLTVGCAATPPGTTAPTPTPTSTTPTLIAAPEPSVAPTAPAASGSATGGQGPLASQVMPAFEAYYAAINAVLQAGGQGAPTQAMRDTMTGDVLDQWTAQAATYRKGYTQRGDIAVETLLPGDFDAAKGTATIDFCIDASQASVVDASGAVVPPDDPQKRATGATATLLYAGGRWRVAKVTGETPIARCP